MCSNIWKFFYVIDKLIIRKKNLCGLCLLRYLAEWHYNSIKTLSTWQVLNIIFLYLKLSQLFFLLINLMVHFFFLSFSLSSVFLPKFSPSSSTIMDIIKEWLLTREKYKRSVFPVLEFDLWCFCFGNYYSKDFADARFVMVFFCLGLWTSDFANFFCIIYIMYH